jgi:hypothetical protein
MLKHMIKNLLFPFVILSLLFATACGDDEDPIIETENPELSLFDDGDVDSSIVESGDTLRVSIQALAGTNEINSLAFFENGVRLPDFADRLFIDGQSVSSNLIPLEGDDRQGFDANIMLLAADEAGAYEVEIVVSDADNNSATVSFSYFVTDVNTLEGVIFNANGPNGGGLDLDSGMNTSRDDPDAEIRDQGIDLSAPADSLNWIQRIEPTNTVVELATLSAEFNFGAVFTQAQVAEAFDDTNTVTQSDVVEVGDMFAVETEDGRNFILLVTDITITPDDNLDNYTFTIKQGQ